jgi:hypothetical protein
MFIKIFILKNKIHKEVYSLFFFNYNFVRYNGNIRKNKLILRKILHMIKTIHIKK